MEIEIDTFDAPAHWASAFVNGDCSGFSDEDQAEFDAWCQANPELCNVVDCSEESFFGRFNGLGCDLVTYTCHVIQTDSE